MFLPSLFFLTLLLFQIHLWSLNIFNRYDTGFDKELVFDCFFCFVFHFHGLHLVTTLKILKPVICFHIQRSFNYGSKTARDKDLTFVDAIRAI